MLAGAKKKKKKKKNLEENKGSLLCTPPKMSPTGSQALSGRHVGLITAHWAERDQCWPMSTMGSKQATVATATT